MVLCTSRRFGSSRRLWRTHKRHIVYKVPYLALQPINSVPRTGHNGAIGSLPQTEHIIPIQPCTLLRPTQSAVVTDEHSTQHLIVHHADIDRGRWGHIPNVRRNLTCRKPFIRWRKRTPSIITREHTSAIRGHEHSIGI